MPESRKSNQRFRITLSLFFIIIGIYFFYFFIVVKQKQDRLVEKGYRVLKQISQNIDDKYLNYQGSILNYSQQQRVIDSLSLSGEYSIILEKLKNLNIPPSDITYLTKRLVNEDTITKKRRVIQEYLSSINNIKLQKLGPDKQKINPEMIRIDEDYYVEIKDLMESLKYDDFFEDIIVFHAHAGVVHSYMHDKSFYSKIQLDSVVAYGVSDYILAAKNYKIVNLPVDIENKNFILIGLIEKQKYSGITNQSTPFTIASIALTLLLFLFSIPLLKLRSLSKYERMSKGDIYLAGLSAVLVSSFTMILFLSIINYFSVKKKIEDNLEYISNSISQTMGREVVDMHHTLKKNRIDSFNIRIITKNNYKIWNELVNIDEHGFIRFYQTGYYPYIGTDSSLEKNFQKINLSSRDYFKEIKRKNEKTSYLEPIYSFTTGYVEAALSHRFGNEMKLITSPMYSVLDIVMPKGYSYYIVDNTGQVLFHELDKKILRENIYYEINNNKQLQKFINQGLTKCMQVSFNGKTKLCKIQPLNFLTDYQYSLLVTYDKELLQNKLIFKLIASGFLLVIFYLFLLIISSLLRLNKNQPVLLKYKAFSFQLLLPAKRNYKSYKVIVAIHLMLIAYLIYFIVKEEHSLNQIFLQVLNTSLLSSFFIYYYLNDVKFVQGLFKNGKFYAEIIMSLLLISIVTTIIINPQNYLTYFLVVILVMGLFKKRWINNNRPILASYKNVYARFYWVAYLWIIAIALLPAVIFYQHSDNVLSQHEIKESVYYYKKQYDKQVKSIINKYKYDNEQYKNKLEDLKIYYEDSLYEKMFGQYSCSFFNPGYPPYQYCHHKSLIDDICNFSKFDEGFLLPEINYYGCAHRNVIPVYEEKSLHRVANFHINYTGEAHLFFQLLLNNSFNIEILENQLPVTLNNNKIEAYIASNATKPVNLGVFVLLLIGVFLLVFIKYRIHVFTNLVKPYYDEQKPTVELAKLKKIGKLLLIGLPGTNKELIVDHITREELVTQRINFSHLSRQEVEEELEVTKVIEQGTIILENFDHNHENQSLNDIRLQYLQALIDKKAKIIFTASVSLNRILDDFFTRWVKASEDQKILIKANMDQLETLLSDYVMFTLPLPSFKKPPLAKELSHGSYLFKLHELYDHRMQKLGVSRFSQLNRKQKEELIIDIENNAHAYYHAVWNQCTRIEKYVLYDAAEDGFINHKNKLVIVNLLKKGLLVFDDGVKIMNRSFQHFILTGISGHEVVQMEEEAKKIGRWSRYSMIIGVLLISFVIFYILAEQEVVNKFMAIITGLVALIPSLFSLGRSALSGFGAKNTGK